MALPTSSGTTANAATGVSGGVVVILGAPGSSVTDPSSYTAIVTAAGLSSAAASVDPSQIAISSFRSDVATLGIAGPTLGAMAKVILAPQTNVPNVPYAAAPTMGAALLAALLAYSYLGGTFVPPGVPGLPSAVENAACGWIKAGLHKFGGVFRDIPFALGAPPGLGGLAAFLSTWP